MQKASWFHNSIHPASVLKKGAESDFVPLIDGINGTYERKTDNSGKKSWWTKHVEQNLPDIIAKMLADPKQPNKDTLFAMQKRFEISGKPNARDAVNIAETAGIKIPATLSRSPNDPTPEYINNEDLAPRTGTLDENTGTLVFHGTPWGNNWLTENGDQKPFDPSKYQQGLRGGTGFYVANNPEQPANEYSVGNTAAAPGGDAPAFSNSTPRSVLKTYKLPSSLNLATIGGPNTTIYSHEELQKMADVLHYTTNRKTSEQKQREAIDQSIPLVSQRMMSGLEQYTVPLLHSILNVNNPSNNIYYLLEGAIPDPIDPTTGKIINWRSAEAKAIQKQREDLQMKMWMAAGYDGIKVPFLEDPSKSYISIHHTKIDQLEHVLDEDRKAPVPDKNVREQLLSIIPDSLDRQPRANLIRQFPETANLIENWTGNVATPTVTPTVTPTLNNKGILEEWKPDLDRQQSPVVPSPEVTPAPVASVTPQKTWFQSLFGANFAAPEPTPTPGGFTPPEPTPKPGGFTPPEPTPKPGGFTPPEPTPKPGGFRAPPVVPTPVPTPVKPVVPERFFIGGGGPSVLRLPK